MTGVVDRAGFAAFLVCFYAMLAVLIMVGIVAVLPRYYWDGRKARRPRHAAGRRAGAHR